MASSLYSSFLRGIVLPIGDRVRRIPIGRELALLNRTQWWPRERIAELRDRKLRGLVAEAYANIPYFRETMAARRLAPDDVRSVADLPKLPLLTKQAIRDNYPQRITNQRIPSKQLTIHRTGGSTGEPLFFALSRATRAVDRASYYRFLEWCGCQRGDLLFSVWGELVVADRHTRFVKAMKLWLITRQIGLDAFNLNPRTMTEFIALMREKRPAVLRGYTSALVELARFVRDEKLEPPPLSALTTTAEQVLPHQRRILEEVFHAPLFDQYGCGEVMGVAYECTAHCGLHIAEEHCIVEVVDDEGNPLPPGVPGKLALTNLDNEATPFIRYVNGDEAALLETTCPCGRALPMMTPVTGRTSDVIFGVNGNRAHGEYFTHLFHELGWTVELLVREFQVVQRDADRLDIAVVCERDPRPEEIHRMKQRITDYLGEMSITFMRVERIDRTRTGKLRFTVREWEPEHVC